MKRIKDTLEKYKHVLSKLPKDILPLMKPHKEIVELAIKPGKYRYFKSELNGVSFKL